MRRVVIVAWMPGHADHDGGQLERDIEHPDAQAAVSTEPATVRAISRAPGVLRAFSTTTRELVASVELKGNGARREPTGSPTFRGPRRGCSPWAYQKRNLSAYHSSLYG